jgi:hypothetical protein
MTPVAQRLLTYSAFRLRSVLTALPICTPVCFFPCHDRQLSRNRWKVRVSG